MTIEQCNEALTYFKEHDAVMFNLLSQSLVHAVPILVPKPSKPEEYFEKIVDSIVGQQISTKAAAAVRTRVHTLLGIVTPETVAAAPDDLLRACGLSPQKLSYLKRNALVWPSIPYSNFNKLSDEAVIAELTKLYGVGQWTAEMFCIFTLARPDVFSYGDLGLMQSLCHYYNYKPHYIQKIKTTVNGWSPHRSLASLALWQARDTGFEV